MDSPAYVSLSLAARAALIEITRGYNGSNNGRIVLSVRHRRGAYGWLPTNTAMRALQELVDKGFIEPQSQRRVQRQVQTRNRMAAE